MFVRFRPLNGCGKRRQRIKSNRASKVRFSRRWVKLDQTWNFSLPYKDMYATFPPWVRLHQNKSVRWWWHGSNYESERKHSRLLGTSKAINYQKRNFEIYQYCNAWYSICIEDRQTAWQCQEYLAVLALPSVETNRKNFVLRPGCVCRDNEFWKNNPKIDIWMLNLANPSCFRWQWSLFQSLSSYIINIINTSQQYIYNTFNSD